MKSVLIAAALAAVSTAALATEQSITWTIKGITCSATKYGPALPNTVKVVAKRIDVAVGLDDGINSQKLGPKNGDPNDQGIVDECLATEEYLAARKRLIVPQ